MDSQTKLSEALAGMTIISVHPLSRRSQLMLLVYQTFLLLIYFTLSFDNCPPAIKHDHWTSSIYGWFSQRTTLSWLLSGFPSHIWLLVSSSLGVIKRNPINHKYPVFCHVVPLSNYMCSGELTYMENRHWNSCFSRWKWWFSIFMYSKRLPKGIKFILVGGFNPSETY